MRGNLVLAGMLFMGSTFVSNGVAYAANGEIVSVDRSEEDSSFYFIHYDGGEHEIKFSENVKLTLTGFTDQSKSSVSGRIETKNDSTNEIKDITFEVNDELHALNVTETEKYQFKLAVSDSFLVEEVIPQELNEQPSTEVISSKESLVVSESNSSSQTNEVPTKSVQALSGSSVISPSVKYSTHIQNIGWQTPVFDGKMSGTAGKALRLEAIKIELGSAPYPGGITYKTHVQDYGWLNNVSDGALSGTSGEAKRLEAIQIALTAEMAQNYDIYYRVHAQDYGWLDWAKNGESAGTQGLSKRLEAIEIVLVSKGGAAPGSTQNPLVIDPSVVYSTHVQDYGWLPQVSDGKMSGTSGQAKRMEAIKISLNNIPYSGGITYKTHVQDYGWLKNVSNGTLSGTLGEAKRVEATQINLTGEMAQYYDIYYRVHAETYGWLGWAKNGESAGTQGFSKRLEAIEVKLVEKGGAAPGSTKNPFIQSDITNYYNITITEALNMQMKVNPQTDKYRNAPAYVSSQYIDVFNGGSINGSSVNLRTSPDLDNINNIAANVGSGTLFKVLDNNVTGDLFSGSTRWYKIEYNGKILYVHSAFVNNVRLGRVNDGPLNIRAEKSANSHSYSTVNEGTILTILEEDNSGWLRVSWGSWRNAKASDVLPYLDPTNFINDEMQKFQFMDLTKPSGVSKETLNKFLVGKGILEGQGQAFIDAGLKYGINEVYLMAHTLLETGHGKSTLATGVVYKDKTVYNMYGVGAYDDCPDECGAKTAYEKGWFTPYAAIVGGAAFIDNGYLNGNNDFDIVQNTIYEMRWNPEVMANNRFASHQYATDIGWAYKQVNTMYEVYKIQPYTVFLELPAYK